jgi:hypothetical protein
MSRDLSELEEELTYHGPMLLTAQGRFPFGRAPVRELHHKSGLSTKIK